MKVLFLTIGNELVASSRTRVYQYLSCLNKNGIQTKVITYESGFKYYGYARFSPKNIEKNFILSIGKEIINYFHYFYSVLNVIRFIYFVHFYDVIFIQKVLLPIWVQKILVKISARIIFDFDDAIYINHSNLLAHNKNQLDYILSVSRLAVLENDETQKYAEGIGIKTLRITGPIDCDRYKPIMNKNKKGEIVIGWIGGPTTIKYFYLIQQPLQVISQKYSRVVIELIGVNAFEMQGVRIRAFKWSLQNEVKLLKNFDIGVMPLPDDEWCRGKGGYKLLQYMAIGIPCVASPVGINKSIILDGKTGFLATTPEDWVSKLSALIENSEMRNEMGREARLRALEKYSLDVATTKLLEALNSIADRPIPEKRD